MPAMFKELVRSIPEAVSDTVDHIFPRVEDDLVRRAFVPDALDAYCRRCGVSAGRGGATTKGCANCLGKRLPWQSIIRLGAYRDPLRQWMLDMKFHGQWYAGKWLGKHLASTLSACDIPDSALIVPVPMHWVRRIHRAYNAPALIALAIASQQKRKPAAALKRTRYTHPQTTVAPSARAGNVRGAFACRSHIDVKGKTILLVDDIKTTGSTAKACTRALKAAGAKQIHLAVVAVADPPNWPVAQGK